MPITIRKLLIVGLATTFLSFAAVVTLWAYDNYGKWYHNTYIEPDPSGAEADVFLLWIQVPTALASWIVGGIFLKKALWDTKGSE